MHFICTAAITLSAASFALAQSEDPSATTVSETPDLSSLNIFSVLSGGTSLNEAQCDRIVEVATCAQPPVLALAAKCEIDLNLFTTTSSSDIDIVSIAPKFPCLCTEIQPVMDTCFPVCQETLATVSAQITNDCANLLAVVASANANANATDNGATAAGRDISTSSETMDILSSDTMTALPSSTTTTAGASTSAVRTTTRTTTVAAATGTAVAKSCSESQNSAGILALAASFVAVLIV
jgi:hypothetical protein